MGSSGTEPPAEWTGCSQGRETVAQRAHTPALNLCPSTGARPGRPAFPGADPAVSARATSMGCHLAGRATVPWRPARLPEPESSKVLSAGSQDRLYVLYILILQ